MQRFGQGILTEAEKQDADGAGSSDFELLRRNEQLASLNTIATTLSNSLDLDEILNDTIAKITGLMRVTVGAIHLLDESGTELHLAAHRGLPEHAVIAVSRMRAGEGVAGQAILAGEPVLLSDYSADPRRFHNEPLHFFVAVPLKAKGIINGMLVIADYDYRPFDCSEIDLLTSIGNQIGVAVENARLYAQTVEKSRRLATISRIIRLVTSNLDLGQVYEALANELASLIQSDWMALVLFDESKENVELAALLASEETRFAAGQVMPAEGTGTEWVAKHRQAHVARDLVVERHFVEDEVLVLEGVRSVMRLPLFSHDEVIGAFILTSKTRMAYRESDLEIMQPIAEGLSIALENARLFDRNRQLYLGSIKALAAAVDAKDAYTHSHSERVALHARRIAEEMGLDADEIELAAKIHDIGKVGIDERILNKRGNLTPSERAMVMSHSEVGALILANVKELSHLVPAVRNHHERFDGRGYPDGLKGESIPLRARVVAVADAFEAMTSDRPYSSARSLETAIQELREGAGSQFDPEIVTVFLQILERDREKGEPYYLELESRSRRQLQTIKVSGDVEQPQPEGRASIRMREVAVIYRISQETGNLVDLPVFLARVLDILAEELGYSSCSILLVSAQTGELTEMARKRPGKARQERLPVPEGGVARWVACHATPVIIEDAEEDQRFRQLENVRSELAVPLSGKSGVFGVLSIESPEPGSFGEYDLQLMMAVAGQISTALEVGQLYDEMKRAALEDGLTGVYNHRHFYRRLEEEISRAERSGESIAVVLFDVIELKTVNDNHGHITGDEVLRRVAAALRKCLRLSDVVARYGGDEFVVMMPGASEPDARKATARVMACLEDMGIELDDGSLVSIAVRCGLAIYPENGLRPIELVAVADDRMYQARRRLEDLRV